MGAVQYNSMGRFFDKRMEELGATRVGQYGEGDDDQDIEVSCCCCCEHRTELLLSQADYDEWKEAITPVLKEEFGCDCDAAMAAAELESAHTHGH